MEENKIKLTLKWNPYSTNNIYYRAWNRWFIKALPKAQKESYILQAKTQKTKFYEWKITVYIKLYFWDKRKRDCDNYSKLILDSLSWIIWNDDKQIYKLTTEKFYDKDNPRAELNIDLY
jgi:crossover junction endodeoxyribonuclease RusA